MAKVLKKPEFCPDKDIETVWKILLRCVKPNVRISVVYADILDCWVFILNRKDYTEQCVRYAHPENYLTIGIAAYALLESVSDDYLIDDWKYYFHKMYSGSIYGFGGNA